MEPPLKRLIEKAKTDKRILAVGIFGSFARGEKDYSDIDVCIFLVPGKYSKIELSRKKLEYVCDELDAQVFQQLPLYIRDRILKEGKILYYKDEDALYDLMYRAMKEIGDFMPKYESYLEGVVNA